MERKRVLLLILGVLTAVSMLLVACGGGNADEPAATSAPVSDGGTTDEETGGDGGDEVVEEAPSATLTPAEQFPELLVVHPEASDFDISEANDTYVYVVPGMVAETLEFVETELIALGWEGLGKPTLMGHLATLNMQMDSSRLTVSMQDNERSETTRVQMVLMVP